jgi:xanthine dehydrogenase YagS FAD-binding subunit
MIERFEWMNASSIGEAVAQLGPTTYLKAGGVDLMDLLKEGLVSPSRLVNLRTVPGLDRLESTTAGLRIGPMVTLARLASDPLVREKARALADAAGHAATPQIRNMATAGGNLLQRPRCWYFRSEAFHCKRKGGAKCFALDGENAYHAVFDNHTCAIVHPSALATALLALGASLELTGPAGSREVPIESFFVSPEVDVRREHSLGAAEMITEIRVPASPGRSAYTKQGQKESYDWPLAEVAVLLETAQGRCSRASVVLGAAAPVPWRARSAEAKLAGQAIDEGVARAAAHAALEGATPLAQNGYKLPVFEAVVRRTILDAAAVQAGGAR